VPWTLFVVGIHVFWSICTPILLTEHFAGERRTTPWLGRRGLIVTAVLFAFGIAATTAINMSQWPYTATAAQFTATAVVVALLLAAGLLIRLRLRPRPGTAPHPGLVLATTLVTAAAFMLMTTIDELPVRAGVTIAVAGIVAFFTLVTFWSAREGWGDAHRLAIGAGALLTYTWHAFVKLPPGGAELAIDLAGHVVFGLAALALLWFARRHRHRSTAAE